MDVDGINLSVVHLLAMIVGHMVKYVQHNAYFPSLIWINILINGISILINGWDKHPLAQSNHEP